MKMLNTKTVENFDLKRYLGTWHQIATIPSWFQLNLTNVKAEYSTRKDGLINVKNSGIGKLSGFKSSLKGTARVVNPEIPATLKVKFFLNEGDYFVLELDEDYQWAMVGGSDKDSLWILSRNRNLSDEIYQMLYQKAKQRGYEVSKLVKT